MECLYNNAMPCGNVLLALERVCEIVDEVLDILHTYRQSNQSIGDPQQRALLRRHRCMRHDRWMFDETLHTSETFGE